MSNKIDQTYSELEQELNILIDELQSGDNDVDEALRKYERGQIIIKQLHDYLKKAENKITKLKIK